jgi:DNA-binding XRE family transcriptional regulator
VPKDTQPTRVFKQINMHGGDLTVCWEWIGEVNKKDGRPYITVDGKRRPSYTVVFELYSGEPAQNRVCRHSCDNPTCCNPNHLSWGSHQDNSNDMMDRDRHGMPATVVRAIRKLIKAGRSHEDIAELYGVARETITAINNMRSHRRVE